MGVSTGFVLVVVVLFLFLFLLFWNVLLSSGWNSDVLGLENDSHSQKHVKAFSLMKKLK